MAVAVAVCGDQGRDPALVYGNAAFGRLTSASPSVTAPISLSAILTFERSETEARGLAGRLATEAPFSETHLFCKADEDSVALRCDWAPLGLSRDGGTCWTVTLTPQSDADALRAELDASEARLAAILDNSPLDICLKDAEGRYVRTSRRFSEIYSVSDDVTRGRLASDLGVSDRWAARSREVDLEVIETGKAVVFEERIPLPSGPMEAITVKFPVIGSSGTFQGVGVICSDVTQRRKLEQALRDSEECLRMIFEHAPLSMNLKDAEGRYTAVSRQLREVHGLTAQEMYGRLPEEVSDSPEWVGRTKRADREVLESGRLLIQEETFQRDGEKRTLLTIKFPRIGLDGQVVGLGSIGTDITERKRAEQALFQSEMEAARTRALLSEAIESMTDGFVWFDNDGKLILCNRKYRELYPRLADELRPGAAYNDLMKLAFDRDQFAVVSAEEVALKQVQASDYVKDHPTFRTKTSEGRWIEARNHPVEAGGFIGIRLDITDRVLAEDALKESEQRFKDFAQSGPGGFWEMDEALRFSSYLDVQTASGRSRPAAQEAIGRTLWELFSVDVEADLYWRAYSQDLDARRPIKDLRAAYTDDQGNRYYWRINGKPFYDRTGRFGGYRGVAEDETAEVEARRRAEAAEARLIDAIESLSEGFALFDADDRLVLSNQTYRNISVNNGAHIVPGITFEEIVRLNVAHGYVPGLEAGEIAEEWIEARLRRHQAAESFLEQDWGDGRSLLITERRTHEGGIACVISDITELQRARAAAERANKDKTRFLAAASHDLRQPLHAIELFVAALEATVEDDEAHELVADIRQASEAAGRLLNALLDVSELETGKLEGRFETFRVQRVLDGLQRVYGQQANERKLSLRMVPCSQLVYSDPDLLERILSNLLSNAVRYTTSGSILLGCRRREGKLRIEVWDTGPGIPEAERVAIFDEFHQLDNSARDRRKGTGLGLSIVRRLANILGHEILLRSVPGSGSMFAVELELGDVCTDEAEAIQPKAGVGFAAQGLEVLVVEDDEQSQKAMSLALEIWGCNVRVAADYDEARDLLSGAAVPVDLIVADYRLPKNVNGVEVASRLRKACGREVPVLIVTADQGKGPRSEIAAHGFKSLRKPVKSEQLKATLAELLDDAVSDSQVSSSVG
ncbi:PAS domain S-box protein [Pelagibius litoralis]|uniref:histidine kinase n=1 Tax=Pelagibius litoralis TaxID=374515 RepID=A0A967EWK2_9PROT|nr:PAS-domain containing protein [Pelagibius litoralis]NIA67203.1 PAS domain S-box protein [Pelagibius litoralis]